MCRTLGFRNVSGCAPYLGGGMEALCSQPPPPPVGWAQRWMGAAHYCHNSAHARLGDPCRGAVHPRHSHRGVNLGQRNQRAPCAANQTIRCSRTPVSFFLS